MFKDVRGVFVLFILFQSYILVSNFKHNNNHFIVNPLFIASWMILW